MIHSRTQNVKNDRCLLIKRRPDGDAVRKWRNGMQRVLLVAILCLLVVDEATVEALMLS